MESDTLINSSSGNGLLPARQQAIILINEDVLAVESSVINLSKTCINFFHKNVLELPSAKKGYFSQCVKPARYGLIIKLPNNTYIFRVIYIEFSVAHLMCIDRMNKFE